MYSSKMIGKIPEVFDYYVCGVLVSLAIWTYATL
jgi:hypothetical protein